MDDNYIDQEREALIERLVASTPYPRSWFEKQPTAALIRMIERPAPTHPRADSIHRKVPKEDDIIQGQPKETRRWDNDTNQWLVYTDGHGWEPEID